jgi:peptidoglycan/LPS O-acetylase OafA/YrhL
MTATAEAKTIVVGENSPHDGEALRKMPQLDGLRAIAVLLVVWSHWWPDYAHIFGTHLGRLGVQLFFVLSGYLISGILIDSSLRDVEGTQKWFVLRQFYIRRFLRIFPIYYLILGLNVLLNVPVFRDTWPWHAAYLSNFHIWVFGIGEGYGAHLWSLSVEEQFYLFWPMLMLFLPKKSRPYFIVPLIVGAPLFRFVFGLMHWGKDPGLVFVLTPASLDSLGLGALLAYVERFKHGSAQRLTDVLLCVGIAGFAAIHISGKLGAFDLTCCGLCCCWLVWKASRRFTGRFGAFLECWPIGYLGRISYGVYLIHGFAFPFWFWALYSARIPGYRVLDRLHVSAQFYQGRPFTVFMMAVITFGLAVLSFQLYETPINNLKRYFPYLKNAFSREKSRA